MPEELNRVLVDHSADLLLAPDDAGRQHLAAEGINGNHVHVVGSTAIDACLRSVRFANRSTILPRLQLESRQYVLCTIHRAENTAPHVLPGLINAINMLAREHTIVVPLHPRTNAAMQAHRLTFAREVRVTEPLGYLDMLQLLRHAQAVLTDSGGLQEEAVALNVPLLILRTETEWSYLVSAGKAVLIGNRPETVLSGATDGLRNRALDQMRSRTCGSTSGAAQRIVQVITSWLGITEERDESTVFQSTAVNA